MMMGKEFFKQAFDEDANGEFSELEQVVDTPSETVETPEVEVVSTEEVTEVIPEVEVIETPKFNIDGEDYTLDQIKEWKQNGLRQSDYTKKTQELAEQRRQLETEGNTFNDDVDTNSDSERIGKLEKDLLNRELDLEITTLKQKYPDFDDIKVINEADKRGIYDLEFIYKAIREDNISEPIDMEAYKNEAIEAYKAEIALKKQTNNKATSGSIVSSSPGQPVIDYGEQLTSSEQAYASKRGWSNEEYVTLKNATYN